MGNERLENHKWHLDKRVSVGHLITTLAIVGAAALWMIRLEGRIDLADQRDNQLNTRIIEIHMRLEVAEAEIIRRLERIQDTLAEHERKSASK